MIGAMKAKRHLAARDGLEDQGARAGGEQRHVGVEAGQERHQDERAEGDEHHLAAEQPLPGPEGVVESRDIVAHVFSLLGFGVARFS
jgi:hypothetical protein